MPTTQKPLRAKGHPVHRFDAKVMTSQRTRDFLHDMHRDVEKDQNDRAGWVQERRRFFRRRYAMEGRGKSWPWPNSSDVVMPLIDKKIDELKPQYVNLVTAANPPVTVLGVDAEAQKKAMNVELWFDYMLRFGSPNFAEEIIHGVDDLLEMGRGIWKTYWHYETRHAPEILTAARLPKRLQQLIVTARTQREADMMFAQMQGQMTVMTLGEFDGAKEQIEAIVAREFQLDPFEPKDQQAFKDIMNWLRGGAQGGLKLKKRDVVISAPAIAAINPLDLIVPEWTTDIESADRITHVMHFNEWQIRHRVKDAGWDAKVVDTLIDKHKPQPHSQIFGNGEQYHHEAIYKQEEADREKMTRNHNQQFEIRETCTWMDIDKDGRDEKVVILYSPMAPDRPLKMYAYARPSQKWPFHTATFEANKKRWYSPRGVPEKLKDLDEEITHQHRAKLDRMTIANSPTFKYRINRGINPRNYRFTPGQFYPMLDPQSDLIPMEMQNLDMSFEREEQVLRTWAEEYLGGTDFGLSNPLGSLSEARTATEINEISNRASASLSLRGFIFQRCMAGIYGEMFDLWHTYGPQEKWVRIVGGDEPIRLTKEELQGKFFFMPTGTIGEQNPQLEAQKALNRVMVVAQLKAQGLFDPEFEVNMGELVMDWMEKEDQRVVKRVLTRRPPEVVQAIKQAEQQANEARQKAFSNQPISMEEASMVAGEMVKKLPFGKAQQLR